MNFSSFTNFLLPDFNDPIQLVFFIIMAILIAGIVFSAHKYACDVQWNKKWSGEANNTASDSLDIEHGSVMDLSHAVATAPEKLADIMPGLLLIIGLLGTFLGLGLALNNASDILSQPNALGVDAAANSMQNLLGMLQGLGTKFKTSTWGIIGFIILKTWSEFTRFEEKRLTWVIRKVKQELDFRTQASKIEDENKSAKLIQRITDSTQETISAYTGCMSKLIDLLIKHENERVVREDKFQDLLIKLNENTLSMNLKFEKGFTSLVHVIDRNYQKTNDSVSEMFSVMKDSNKQKNITLNLIREELQLSSKTISEFSNNTHILIKGMQTASDQMAEGARGVGVAASGLVAAVESFESKFTVVLDQISTDLGSAINDMSRQAAHTLETGSNKLHAATTEISIALGKLSEDVQSTMNEVQGAISKALDIQQKSSQQFIISSNILAEKTQMSIDMTEKLTKPIEFGLTAISASNREQVGVVRRLDSSIIELQEMSKILSTFSQMAVPIEKIAESLSHSLLKIDNIYNVLASENGSGDYHDVANFISGSMQRLEKQLLLINTTLQNTQNFNHTTEIQNLVELK